MEKIMKLFLALFLSLVAVNSVFAQTSPVPQAPQQKRGSAAVSVNAGAKLPTKDEVELAMKRNFGYDPSITWAIYDIRPSAIPGLADVLLSLNRGAEKGPPQHIYMSTETQ